MRGIQAKIKYIPFIAIAMFFAVPVTFAQSPALFFRQPVDYIGVGDEFSVSLLVDTHGEVINTVVGDLIFTDESISVKRVETGNSIVTTWIESPTVSGNSIKFSGLMPGGYESVIDTATGSKIEGEILKIVFLATRAGSATLSFSESEIYLNDSFGTEASALSLPYTISILEKGQGQVIDLNDNIPPEHFIPIISSSPELYDGAYTLFFSTTDKGSGIDHYEVSENGNIWVRADSPYKLTDQSILGEVRVKAIDLAGNYVIERVAGTIKFNNYLVVIPLSLFVLALILIYIFYHKKMKKYEKSI